MPCDDSRVLHIRLRPDTTIKVFCWRRKEEKRSLANRNKLRHQTNGASKAVAVWFIARTSQEDSLVVKDVAVLEAWTFVREHLVTIVELTEELEECADVQFVVCHRSNRIAKSFRGVDLKSVLSDAFLNWMRLIVNEWQAWQLTIILCETYRFLQLYDE